MNIEGKIKMIDETKTYGNNGFRKREFVVTTEEQYPQKIVIELVQDKTEVLNSFKVGDRVNVSINLRGREWVSPQGDTKYFNTIQGWKIEKLEGETVKEFETVPVESLNEDDHDDLPF